MTKQSEMDKIDAEINAELATLPEEERADAEHYLRMAKNVDPVTGFMIDPSGDITAPSMQQNEFNKNPMMDKSEIPNHDKEDVQTAEAGSETGNDTSLGGGQQTDPAPETEGTEAKEPEKKAGEQKVEPTESEELTRYKEENERLRAENARHAANERMSSLTANIRQKVAGEVAKQRQVHQDQIKAEDREIQEHRDLYGDEAADVLKAKVEAHRVDREARIKNYEESETRKLQDEVQSQVNYQQSVDQALNSVPELRAWKAEYDSGKSTVNFDMAIKIDEVLKEQPEWKDKPMAERFGEVVKRVRLSLGMESTGSPSVPESGKQPGLTDKQVEQQLKKPLSENAPGAPGSLSSIEGGGDDSQDQPDMVNMPASEIWSLYQNDPNLINKIDSISSTFH